MSIIDICELVSYQQANWMKNLKENMSERLKNLISKKTLQLVR